MAEAAGAAKVPALKPAAQPVVPAAEPKSPPAPRGPASPQTPAKKGERVHRVPEHFVALKKDLKQSKTAADKALRKVLAKSKVEDQRLRRLVAKAQSLPMGTLVKIVQMKIEIPNIECPHCACCFPPSGPLSEAHRAVLAGRDVHFEFSGKTLATSPNAHPSTSSVAAKKPDA